MLDGRVVRTGELGSHRRRETHGTSRLRPATGGPLSFRPGHLPRLRPLAPHASSDASQDRVTGPDGTAVEAEQRHRRLRAEAIACLRADADVDLTPEQTEALLSSSEGLSEAMFVIFPPPDPHSPPDEDALRAVERRLADLARTPEMGTPAGRELVEDIEGLVALARYRAAKQALPESDLDEFVEAESELLARLAPEGKQAPDARPTVEALVDMSVRFAAYFGGEAGEMALGVAEGTVATARQQVADGNPNWTPEQTRDLSRSVDRADRRLRAARPTVRLPDLAAVLRVRAVQRGSTRAPRGRRVVRSTAASRDGPEPDEPEPPHVAARRARRLRVRQRGAA